jgi:protein O-GlcNAc transferase
MNIKREIEAAFKLHQEGNLQQAENIYKKILEKQPSHFDALHMLGVLSSQLRNHVLALQYIGRALQINPESFYAHYNLGNVLKSMGQDEKALSSYQKALQLNPDFVPPYLLLGEIYLKKGRLDEAMDCFQKALNLDPDIAEAYNNLGVALKGKGRLPEAITSFQRALQLKPDFSNAYYNLGNTLREEGRLKEAGDAYDMAVRCQPSNFKAHWAKCISQLPVMYSDQSDIAISRNKYHDALVKLHDTISLKTPQDIEAANEAVGSQQPFYLAYQGFHDLDLQRIYGNLVHRIMASRYPQFARLPAKPAWSPGMLLRIGVVTGHFYHHTVWKLFKGWFENLDRERFSLYGYYTGRIKDAFTEDARQQFSRFVEDIYSFEELCHSIRNDNLHVLIYPEIGMDPISLRLAALRLAPVQCISWGHPDTSGLPTIDYFLSSDLMEPPEADEHYTEKLIRLPNLSISYTPVDIVPVPISRTTFNLRQYAVLYLCCQSLFKYLPQYDEVFPRIAEKVKDCQFLFISHTSNYVTEQFRSRISKVFHRFSIKPDDYIVFLPRLDIGQYYAINRLSDIYLDSIGWSGGNTTLEAIACNLPIVTLPGPLMRGRHSTAMLIMMGVAETIADSLDEYISIAMSLGNKPEQRKEISEKIADKKYLIYADRSSVSALEDFLEQAVGERITYGYRGEDSRSS